MRWVAVGVAMLVVGGWLVTRPPAPALLIGESVGPDFRAVAEEFWPEFEAFAEARLDCFGPVTLEASFELADRAEYEPTTKTLTVRVPRSPESLRESLAHELAHHVEHDCPAHEDLRPAFLEAMGLSPDADWFAGDRWPEIPSERFAEATAELMLGGREITYDVFLSEAELGVVGTWWSDH